MRALIFGDVHGNLVALEKMLQKERGEADMLVSHGDVVNYGPWSNECVQLLDSIGCTCLRGNHEAAFLQGSYPGENAVVKAFFQHCYASFTEHNTIATYGDSVAVGDYKVQHTVNDRYIYPDTDVEFLNLQQSAIIGHSHHQFAAETASGIKLFNTGSVGQNRKFINVINYIIYDTSSAEVSLEALVYDVDVVIDKMISENYPSICLEYYQQKKRL